RRATAAPRDRGRATSPSAAARSRAGSPTARPPRAFRTAVAGAPRSCPAQSGRPARTGTGRAAVPRRDRARRRRRRRRTSGSVDPKRCTRRRPSAVRRPERARRDRKRSIRSAGMLFPVVLFDLDGTLVDSAAAILGSFHHATETVLRRRFPDEQILAQIGGTNLTHQMQLLDPDPERVDEPIRVYREHNDPQYAELACFAGVVDVLEQLRGEGRRLGVVTAKRKPTVERVFAGAGIGR